MKLFVVDLEKIVLKIGGLDCPVFDITRPKFSVNFICIFYIQNLNNHLDI